MLAKLSSWSGKQKILLIVAAVLLIGAGIITAFVGHLLQASASTQPALIKVVGKDGSFVATILASTPSNVNLTEAGNEDWANWGMLNDYGFNHKRGVQSQISNYTQIGNGKLFHYVNTLTQYSWTDGTPATTGTNVGGGVKTVGLHNGFQITVPAGKATRVLKIFVGVWKAQGLLQISMSGGTEASYPSLELSNADAISHGVYTLVNRAATDDQKMTVSFTADTVNDPLGCVSLQAATLAMATNTNMPKEPATTGTTAPAPTMPAPTPTATMMPTPVPTLDIMTTGHN